MVVFLIGGALFAAGLFPGPREVVGALLPDALTASMIAQEEVFKTASDCAGAWLYAVGVMVILWGVLRRAARKIGYRVALIITIAPPVGLTVWLFVPDNLETAPLGFLFFLLIWWAFWGSAATSGRKEMNRE